MPDGMHSTFVAEAIEAAPTRKRIKKLSKKEKWRLEWERKYAWKHELKRTESSGIYGKDNYLGHAIACRFLANVLLTKIREAADELPGFDASHALSDLMLELAEMNPEEARSRQGIIVGFGTKLAEIGYPARNRSARDLFDLAARYDGIAANYDQYHRDRAAAYEAHLAARRKLADT